MARGLSLTLHLPELVLRPWLNWREGRVRTKGVQLGDVIHMLGEIRFVPAKTYQGILPKVLEGPSAQAIGVLLGQIDGPGR